MGGASKLLMLLSTPFPLLYPRPAALRLARPSRFPLSPLSTLSSPAFFPHTPTSPSQPRPPLSARAGEPHGTPAVITQSFTDLPGSRPSHPWPEWSNLVDHLTARCYPPRQLPLGEDDDSFAVDGEVPGEFVRAAEMCLSFARDRPDVLRLLSKKDIQVIVENGSPLLFKNGANSVRRMRSFLSGLSAVWESDKAQTVDIMRYLLSYAYSSLATSGKNSFRATEPTEASARSLLNELVNVSGTVQESSFTMSTPRQTPLRPEQFSRPPGQNIEMKRGDWICSKCSFMNFARNIKCLECNDERPKRQLTGGEWECPQCDFFNYGRNMSCLRCDCKRPGEAPIPRTSSGSGGTSSFEQILNRSSTNKSELERKLAANDEKAEKWFSKVANLDDASDLSRAAADEDFPEIMPLRKGVNRFVVSTRKTPLERRLANAQYEGNASQSEKTTESSISQSLDRILGRTSSPSSSNPQNQRRDPDSVPFVPLPPDMFTKKSDSEKDASSSDSPSAISGNPIESKITTEPSDASERWSKKVAELDSATDLASAISDEDFPEIMPMRKGENRFVVSKKKDRSLTSPQYKRRLAMEQANNSDFVDFVPFPPDYFAKKDKQPEATEVSTPPQQVRSVTEKLPETKHVDYNEGRMETSYGGPTTDPVQPINYSQDHSKDSWASGATQNNSTYSASSAPRTSQPAQSSQKAWKYSGKSLEGSAVKEPDPLDMSEEAKAERWFRRVAQIKDISELSQIPDEDFPEIMPMRKGVNRFVVSKRKTPLERRLTSPQYRRNLPTVRSEPEKDSE